MSKTRALLLATFVALAVLAWTGFVLLQSGQIPLTTEAPGPDALVSADGDDDEEGDDDQSPLIIWEPESVIATISPGETMTVCVSLASSEEIEDVLVLVSPELVPFVGTDPSSFEEIEDGETGTLCVTVSAAQDSPLGTFEGAIQITEEDADDDDDEFGAVLPVLVNVWESISEKGLIALYPPEWGRNPRFTEGIDIIGYV